MSRDLETAADIRAEHVVGALEVVAQMLEGCQPGWRFEGVKLANLIGLIAADLRAVHDAGADAPAAAGENTPCR